MNNQLKEAQGKRGSYQEQWPLTTPFFLATAST
jgi:hypothetical protein